MKKKEWEVVSLIVVLYWWVGVRREVVRKSQASKPKQIGKG